MTQQRGPSKPPAPLPRSLASQTPRPAQSHTPPAGTGIQSKAMELCKQRLGAYQAVEGSVGHPHSTLHLRYHWLHDAVCKYCTPHCTRVGRSRYLRVFQCTPAPADTAGTCLGSGPECTAALSTHGTPDSTICVVSAGLWGGCAKPRTQRQYRAMGWVCV
eukprot:3941812-Rhodomonas_salina.11